MKLRCWYSIHGAIEVSPRPLAMLACVHPRVVGLAYNFEPDEERWRRGQFQRQEATTPAILVSRIGPGDEGFIAADKRYEEWLSTMSDEPHRDFVLAHLHRTRQTVNLIPVDFTLGMTKLARVCEQLCGFLARETDGLIQVFQEGFFSPQGESLLPHCPRHKLKTK